MRTRARFLVVCVGAVMVFSAATYAATRLQTAQSATDSTAALLTEVHALRLAMEQNAAVFPRVQLTLARLTIEEQRIAQLASQLDQIRKELSTAALETQKVADRIPEIDKGLQTASEPQSRRSYEYEQDNVKRQLAAQSRLEQLLRGRENETVQALNTEQARWIELNARLDELERLLAPVSR